MAVRQKKQHLAAGPGTFSAAIDLLAALDRHSQVIDVAVPLERFSSSPVAAGIF